MMSRTEFLLPDLGEGIDEAEVVSWFVQPGDAVEQHQPLVEVQTDKALVELPSPITGTLVSHAVPAGGTIKLGGLVAVFDSETDAPSSTDDLPSSAPVDTSSSSRPLAAPTVRQLARELDVDLARVVGTGAGGRVLKKDVQQAAEVSASGQTPATRLDDHRVTAIPDPASSGSAVGNVTRVPLRGLRRAVARKMTQTLQTVPQVTGMAEVDVTELSRGMEQLRAGAEAHGVRLTWTALFALATVQALTEFPELNASLDDEHEEIVLFHDVHLGIATATDDGLLVPVVFNAQGRSLLDLASEITRVSELARTRQASVGELTGSTFTITNYGSVGGWYGTPMINSPEVGIVGFGQVTERPAVVEGELAVRTMVAMSHTVDHRLIDGAVNAAFGSAIRRRLEHPELLLLGVRNGDG